MPRSFYSPDQINFDLDADRLTQRSHNPELFDRIAAEVAASKPTTKRVRDLRAGDTFTLAGLRVRAIVLDNERLGYGKWRVTYSREDTKHFFVTDLPGTDEVYT